MEVIMEENRPPPPPQLSRCSSGGGVEFQTVLRLRPLSKKERDDAQVLELVELDNDDTHNNNTTKTSARIVLMHPQPLISSGNGLLHSQPGQSPHYFLSPSSALVRQTIDDPDAHDVEFQFDQVWSADATQDKLYFGVGLPMALQAMEPLKKNNINNSHTTNQAAATKQRTNHLIIGMGLTGSGKSYTCWGGPVIHSKRKQEADGLIPRIVDSMFSQSKHHIIIATTSNSNNNNSSSHNVSSKRNINASFAVRIKALAVQQHKTKLDDGTVHDLLQSPVGTKSRTFAIASSFSKTRNRTNTGSSSRHSHNNATTSDAVLLGEEEEDEDQQPRQQRKENGSIRTCTAVEEARESLQMILTNASKMSSKRQHMHVLITLQPILFKSLAVSTSSERMSHQPYYRTGGSSSNWIRVGGKVSVLDMAGYRGPAPQSDNHRNNKESLPTAGNDAYAALFHCLRTLQHNESTPSAKKIPFRQHKLTMLLQPLFTMRSSSTKTVVTVLTTASPSGREYSEKRKILNKVQVFRNTVHYYKAQTTETERASTTIIKCSQKGTKEPIVVDESNQINKKPINDNHHHHHHHHHNNHHSKTAMNPQNTQSFYSSSLHHSTKTNPNLARARVAYCDADDEDSTSGRRVPRVEHRSIKGSTERKGKKHSTTKKKPIRLIAGHPDAVAPGMSNCISSSFSSSDDELKDSYEHDDILPVSTSIINTAPLPPPMAPSYDIFKKASLSSSVLSYEATAPVETNHHQYLSHAGIDSSLSLNQVHSLSSDNESTPSCPPPVMEMIELSDPIDKDRTFDYATTSFSPMKTLNKVVCASKKQGLRVFDKMSKLAHEVSVYDSSNTHTNTSQEQQQQQQQRLEALENHNQRLLEENDTLRSTNERLENEINDLRLQLENYDNKETFVVKETIVERKENDWNYNHHPIMEEEDPNYVTNGCALFDNALFQHMAVVGGGEYHNNNRTGTNRADNDHDPPGTTADPFHTHARMQTKSESTSLLSHNAFRNYQQSKLHSASR